MSVKLSRILLLSGAIVLSVLLFIAPKTAPQAPKAEVKATTVSADNKANLDVYMNMAAKNLATDQKQILDRLVKENKTDSLINFWDKNKRPDLASVYSEEAARISNTAQDWFNAGRRYYLSVQFTPDKTEAPLLYQCSMRCLSRSLKLQPNNTDARILLASCFVEGTQDPMQGISMLRELEKADSNNIKVQLSFAFFSKKSGQRDKAIARFKKVLAIDSNYIEVYLHLADLYEEEGKSAEAIKMLEKYLTKTPDPTERAEINKYIMQLKQP